MRLRAAVPGDAQTLFKVVENNRSFLREWLPWLDRLTNVEQEVAFLNEQVRRAEAKEGLLMLIELRGEIVGSVGVNRVEEGNRAAWLGYWLDRAHGGGGLMTRSVRALAGVLLGTCGFHRLVIEAAVGNISSRSVAERLGFRLEGTHVDGQWLYNCFVDSVEYAVTAPEWAASANAAPSPPKKLSAPDMYLDNLSPQENNEEAPAGCVAGAPAPPPATLRQQEVPQEAHRDIDKKNDSDDSASLTVEQLTWLRETIPLVLGRMPRVGR